MEYIKPRSTSGAQAVLVVVGEHVGDFYTNGQPSIRVRINFNKVVGYLSWISIMFLIRYKIPPSDKLCEKSALYDIYRPATNNELPRSAAVQGARGLGTLSAPIWLPGHDANYEERVDHNNYGILLELDIMTI